MTLKESFDKFKEELIATGSITLKDQTDEFILYTYQVLFSAYMIRETLRGKLGGIHRALYEIDCKLGNKPSEWTE